MRNNCAQKRKCDAGDVHAQRVDGAAIPWTTARVWAAFFCHNIAFAAEICAHTVCLRRCACHKSVPVTVFRQNALNNTEKYQKCFKNS